MGAFGGRPATQTERGDSLIEILITIVIVAVGIVGIIPALANSLSLADRYRKHSKVDQITTQVIDAIQSATYVCGDATSYDAVTLTPLATASGQTISVTTFEYWTPANVWAAGSCPSAPNDGPLFKAQRITVQVAALDGRARRTVQVVKRP